jgi:acetylornithine/succinyldiaminopimelate/putrescine aminotransferase
MKLQRSSGPIQVRGVSPPADDSRLRELCDSMTWLIADEIQSGVGRGRWFVWNTGGEGDIVCSAGLIRFPVAQQ